MKRMNKTALFLMLTFFINYCIVGIFYACGGQLNNVSGMAVGLIYMFIPMLSVLVVEKVVHRNKIKETLYLSFKINIWFFIAWFITPVLGFATFGISLLFPDVNYSPEMTGMMERLQNMMTPEQMEQMRKQMEILPFHPIWISVIQGLIAGVTINAVAGFGEEIGWRGFLLKEFSYMHFWKASLLIGFIWGIWHAPLILLGHNYPQHRILGVFMMTVWCILLTPLFNYIRIKSKSVIAAAIMHGTLNGTAGIAIIVIDGGNDLTVGITGLAGFITLMMAIIGLYIYDNWIVREKIMQNKISYYHSPGINNSEV